MRISIPRSLIVTLAAVFSGYHVVLALVSLDMPVNRGPYLLAVVLYIIATVLSLLPSSSTRMEVWLASFNVSVAVAISLLVTSQLPDGAAGTYGAWHTAAIGTLLVITSTRRRQSFAWIGLVALAVETTAWQGVGGLLDYGVAANFIWVGVAHALSYSLASADRDARQYALAEREAAAWRAAQEAHVFERQFRLGQTSRMAMPMLRQVVATGGDLTEAQRRECLYLEGAIRDEIRGRTLLNDRVRLEVMAARRRGAVVTLLDEGGIDDLEDGDLDRVLNGLADAIGGTRSDRIIARTVPLGSEIAVTVVGLSSSDDGESVVLGQEPDGEDVEITLWLELPRMAPARV